MTNPLDRRIDRRSFIVRAGVLGAAAGIGAEWLRARPAAAGGHEQLVDAIAPVLRELARDTIGGLVALVVPGPDAYSEAQGLVSEEPGGVDAGAVDFLLEALDHFFPLPDEMIRPFIAAMSTSMSESPIDLPPELLEVPFELAEALDDAFAAAVQSDATAPLAVVIALTLNFVATRVDPTALAGPYPAPFANLSHDNKVEVFRVLEEEDAELLALVDEQLPEPLHASLSGLLKFVPGALIEFAAFGSYSEFGALDRETRTLRGVPIGWQLSRYLEETGFQPVEGWDDLQGFWQNRRSVTS